jgi:hypothetical protein
VFVRDRNTGTTSRIAAGTNPALSADGRYVAFQGRPVDVLPASTSEQGEVFVQDRRTGTVILVSVAAHGAPADDFSYQAALSGDGRRVAYHSAATNLVPADTNATGDIFTSPTR